MIAKEQEVVDEFVQEENEVTRDITIGELVEENVIEPDVEEETLAENRQPSDERDMLRKGIKGFFRKGSLEPVNEKEIPSEPVGDINPYTRKEYESNSVRMHPKRFGYVQVYDRETHKWTDMTEWAFLGYQERKKKLLGKDYKPPIYLD